MRIAPIIHTRTFSCDFNSEFLTRPEKFMDSDIKWARKNVLEATSEIDGLQGVRWLIADNEKYRMAGVIGFSKNICSKCQLSESDKQSSEELFYDDKGRLVYAFIGVVIDKFDIADYGKVTCEDLWKMYLEKMHPVWKKTYQEVMLEKFTDIEVEKAGKFMPESPTVIGTKELFESNQTIDYDLFISYLCDKNKSHFSFCSNIVDFNIVKQSHFSIITTSQNTITRMKRENDLASGSASNKQPLRGKVEAEEKEPISSTNNKKKPFTALMICVVILLILILMSLLKMRNLDHQIGQLVQLNVAKEMSVQNQPEEMTEYAYIDW